MGGKNKIFITGEVNTKANLDINKIVNRVLKSVGYLANYEIINNLGKQSIDISVATNDFVGGAGDNGMMFGYAIRETDKLLPKAMIILQEFSMLYDELRKKDNRFLPDGKALLTGYYENNRLIKIKTFTICYQNTEMYREETDNILKNICKNICYKYNIEIEEFKINPTGRFFIGGFDADAGLTGRKTVVDTYQSFAKVGGGAMSGKDPTKVDRSGTYKAREIAVKILNENKNFYWCKVQISYIIGLEYPANIYIETDKGIYENSDKFISECRVKNIIKDLNLKNICYEKLAMFGQIK